MCGCEYVVVWVYIICIIDSSMNLVSSIETPNWPDPVKSSFNFNQFGLDLGLIHISNDNKSAHIISEAQEDKISLISVTKRHSYLEISVINDSGFSSGYFYPNSGIKQGCCSCPSLFGKAAEFPAIMVPKEHTD